jgi:hypothetical protein
MEFLKKIVKSLLGSGGGVRRSPMLDFDVRCNRCGEVIHGQINLNNDLSVQYDGDYRTYFCRKVLVGSGETRCFQQVTVEYTFDAQRTVIERRVDGGRFVEPDQAGDADGDQAVHRSTN